MDHEYLEMLISKIHRQDGIPRKMLTSRCRENPSLCAIPGGNSGGGLWGTGTDDKRGREN